jgi:excisionase family DNA binding protein
MFTKNLLTADEAATHLNVSVRTLAKWRSVGHPNLPYSKVGRCVRYMQRDLEAYLDKHSFNRVGG